MSWELLYQSSKNENPDVAEETQTTTRLVRPFSIFNDGDPYREVCTDSRIAHATSFCSPSRNKKLLRSTRWRPVEAIAIRLEAIATSNKKLLDVIILLGPELTTEVANLSSLCRARARARSPCDRWLDRSDSGVVSWWVETER